MASVLAMTACGDDPPANAGTDPTTGDTTADTTHLTGGTEGDTAADTHVYRDEACLLDGDCGPGLSCVLGTCAAGCQQASDCDEGRTCDPHGRCVEAMTRAEPRPSDPRHAASFLPATPDLDREGRARGILRNDGDRPMQYRLTANVPGLAFDEAPKTLAPGQSVELSLTSTPAGLQDLPPVFTVSVLTDAKAFPWNLLSRAPRTGHYRGRLAFLEPHNLGTADLGLDLEFADDGTITGVLHATKSPLFFANAAITGTWDDTGDVVLRLADLIPDGIDDAGDRLYSPFARSVGRELTLEGHLDEHAGTVEGRVFENLSGLVGEYVEIEGEFVLRRHSPVVGTSAPPDLTDTLPLPVPSLDVVSALDAGACAGLGSAYGTAKTNFPKANAPEVAACSACAGTCTPFEASTCATGLAATAGRIDQALPVDNTSTLEGPNRDAWSDCVDDTSTYDPATGQTCWDAPALRCAEWLARFAVQTETSPWMRPGYVAQWFDIVAKQTLGANLRASEKLVQASFAYRNAAPGSTSVLEEELRLVASAAHELYGVLSTTQTFRYLRSLDALGREALLTERKGIDLRRTLVLARRYAEVLLLQARLEQRGSPTTSATDMGPRIHAFAVWLHVLAALGQHEFDLFRFEDTYDELSVLGETVLELQALARELTSQTNPFGYDDAYVPMLLSPIQASQGTANFTVVRDAAETEVGQFEQRAQAAEQAEDAFWQSSWEAAERRQQVLNSYDERLGDLCGFNAEGEPSVLNCGHASGQLYVLWQEMQAAAHEASLAVKVLENSAARIAIEENRILEILLNAQETQMLIDTANQRILTIQDNAGMAKDVLAQARAQAECGQAKAARFTEHLDTAANCLSETAGSKYTMIPLVVASCTLHAVATEQRTLQTCTNARENAGLEQQANRIDAIEQRGITIVNAEIDRIVRQSALNESVISSRAAVEEMRLASTEAAISVEIQQNRYNAMQGQFYSALEQVGALVARRDRTLALLADNPSDGSTRPRFLQARLALGEDVMRWRELAVRRAYLATRALEYEINREAATVRQPLYAARSPFEVRDVMVCLDTIFEDYRLAVGVPQHHTTEISLREDVFGLRTPIEVAVTGRSIDPMEQFQAILASPAARLPDGSLQLTFVVSLVEDALFSRLLCDDKIQSLEAKVVGDQLGDGEIELVVERRATSSLRRCDAEANSGSDSITTYAMPGRRVVITAGANDFGASEPNAGFAAWPVGGEGWTVSIPPGTTSPANADLDVDSIADIVLRLQHRAGTVGAPGVATFVPTCN